MLSHLSRPAEINRQDLGVRGHSKWLHSRVPYQWHNLQP